MMKNYIPALMVCMLFISGPLTASERPAEAGANVLFSQSTLKLEQDVPTFDKDLNTYIDAAGKIDKDVQRILTVLDKIQTLGDDLQKLDDALTTVEGLIDFAKKVPESREAATAMSAQMAVIHPQVTSANKAVAKFNTKAAPYKSNLQTLDINLQKFITTASAFEQKLNKYTNYIEIAQECIGNMPPGPMNEAMQKDLDKLSNESDTRVVEADKVLKDGIRIADDLKKDLDNIVNTLLKPIEDIDRDIVDLAKKLNGIIEPLRDLEKLFHKDFCVKIPEVHKFCMGLDVIIQGADAIEHEIRHILGKELYRIAKIFGIEKIVKDLTKQGEKELRSVMDALHLDFDVKVPGLDQLEQEIGDLERAMDAVLPKLGLDLSPIEKVISDIEKDIDAMKKLDCR
jgi:hypothetical protein